MIGTNIFKLLVWLHYLTPAEDNNTEIYSKTDIKLINHGGTLNHKTQLLGN